jgi:transcriptional regulator with XRE-family HTH domain
MTSIKEKLNKIASKEPSKWMQNAEWRISNEGWLDNSAKIAFKILRAIREQKISQKELADRLNVSPQHISKIVKGYENFTLETLDKIEKVLGISLIEVPGFQTVAQFKIPSGELLWGNYTKKAVTPFGKYDYSNPPYNTMQESAEENQLKEAA